MINNNLLKAVKKRNKKKMILASASFLSFSFVVSGVTTAILLTDKSSKSYMSKIEVKESYVKNYTSAQILRHLSVISSGDLLSKQNLEKFIILENFPDDTNFFYTRNKENFETNEMTIFFYSDKYNNDSNQTVYVKRYFDFTISCRPDPSSKMTTNDDGYDKTLNFTQVKNLLTNNEGKIGSPIARDVLEMYAILYSIPADSVF
ncbi:MAG: hypothetical protein ACRC42_03875, partial [Mycoplasma sp.]